MASTSEEPQEPAAVQNAALQNLDVLKETLSRSVVWQAIPEAQQQQVWGHFYEKLAFMVFDTAFMKTFPERPAFFPEQNAAENDVEVEHVVENHPKPPRKKRHPK
jgi:hypothetical protein